MNMYWTIATFGAVGVVGNLVMLHRNGTLTVSEGVGFFISASSLAISAGYIAGGAS